MEDKGQGAPGAGPAVETAPPPVEAAIDQQIGRIEDAAEGINPAQNQQAVEQVEENLAGQGPDAALEGLAQEGEQPGPGGESPTEQTDGAQAPGTEQNAQGAQAPGENADGTQAQGQEAQQDQREAQNGAAETAQEQQAQPETMEQQVTRLQEQVTTLTAQNEALTQGIADIRTQLGEVFLPILKSLVEKAQADEKDPEKKISFGKLLMMLALAATSLIVGEGARQVQRASAPGR